VERSVESPAVAAAVAAIAGGGAVILATDGVYGLCADAEAPHAVAELARLKQRPAGQPCALLAASLEELLERIPELHGRCEAIARALLPGPYTLVLPNPARRYGWLSAERPETIGVRVALLPQASGRVLELCGMLAATSANLSGGADPASLAEVPAVIREGCDAQIDAGRLSGTPSTVLDFSGDEPAVLRSGAGSVAEALARAARALGE